MFKLLSFFNENKQLSDPFANRKTVTLWLSQLPSTDTQAVHSMILDALAQLRNQNQYQQKEHLDAIIALDDYTQPLQEILSEQYLRNARMSTAMEIKLRESIYNYYSEITNTYFSFINVAVNTHAIVTLGAHFAQICLRVLRNIGHLFKWRFFHYEQPDEELWYMLHKVYSIAESAGFHTQISSSKGANESTCVSQYVRALLLAQIHPSALQAKQIEMADLWLLKWVHLVEIEKTITSGRHHFYVNLAKPVGACPVSNQDYPDSCRYWDASLLLGQLRRTRHSLKKNPQNFQTDSLARLPEYLKMLDYVELQWDPNNLGKLRKTPRIAAKKILHVVHGFSAIRTAVKNSELDASTTPEYDADMKYAEMVDIQLYGFVTASTRNRQQKILHSAKPTMIPYENWEAENESAKGYLARSPANKNDWLRLGCLAGVKTADEKNWEIAVVRRLSKARNASLHVGMEVISQKPSILPLYSLTAVSQNENATSPLHDTTILALLTSPIQNGHLTLIIESVQYAKDRQFEIATGPSRIQIKLNEVLEKGDSWIYVAASLIP